MKLIYQKLTLSEAAQYRAIARGKKNLCKNLMVKEGGGCLLEGAVFSGTYSISHITAQIFNYLQYTETEGEG